jgi:nucleoside-diphosphate-sugar epimerase
MSNFQYNATVIGGQGFIGRALIADLQLKGWECWVPDRGIQWPQPQRDLGHVFYCAGLTADYLARPVDTVEAHISLLSRVLKSPNYQSLVYLSSTRLYDGLPTGSLADENADFHVNPFHSRHLYDLTKLTGESLCYHMGQGRARIARLSCVYDHTPDAEGFLPELLRALARSSAGATISLASSPHFARDYVYVRDVVQALVGIATKGTQLVYNVASGETLHNFELANEVAKICNRNFVFEYDQIQAEPARIDVRRLQSLLDWRPESVFKTIGPWLRALPG